MRGAACCIGILAPVTSDFPAVAERKPERGRFDGIVPGLRGEARHTLFDPFTLTVAAVLLVLTGCAGSPSYLHPHGVRGHREAALGWVLLIIAALVCVVVAILVVAAVYRRRHAGPGLSQASGGLRWIIIGGIAVPALILLGVLILAMTTLRADVSPPSRTALTVQIIGHRWWWEIRYPAAVRDAFITANEIHIPTRQPVRLELTTADVIHSFWIPQLAGKTDLIPGQRNISWIEADSAGRYLGECGEYCGLQHAKMQMYLQADTPSEFQRWLVAQRGTAQPADSTAAGRRVFERSACAACHTIRGTAAAGVLGPDLTHLASRRTIAGGILPNTPGNLAGWIANPQGIKPGTVMPVVPLSPGELHAVLRYLRSLR
jgi:cytochrome c oxidase subunit 2